MHGKENDIQPFLTLVCITIENDVNVSKSFSKKYSSGFFGSYPKYMKEWVWGSK